MKWFCGVKSTSAEGHGAAALSSPGLSLDILFCVLGVPLFRRKRQLEGIRRGQQESLGVCAPFVAVRILRGIFLLLLRSWTGH
ncbi:hypothetical protein RRG08_047615 [Elysia crispata]|uniref:Uncharacterized protein n=1 Tax=Elysia crispata TaxID=231223 RepID=A0AAE1BFT8_9GAST|nr:hypothetical protein RRG08_047615 [Elysia crispata]